MKNTWNMLDFPPTPIASKSIATRMELLHGCCNNNIMGYTIQSNHIKKSRIGLTLRFSNLFHMQELTIDYNSILSCKLLTYITIHWYYDFSDAISIYFLIKKKDTVLRRLFWRQCSSSPCFSSNLEYDIENWIEGGEDREKGVPAWLDRLLGA